MSRTPTTRLGLSKPNPGSGEPYDASVDLGSNWDGVDAAIGFTECVDAARPTGADAWGGRPISVTDTNRAYLRRAGVWRQIPVASSTGIAIDVNTQITGTLSVSSTFTNGNSATNVARFSADGTWTKPAGAKTVWVRCWGGGGAGGGAAATAGGQASCGNGGQEGAYAESWFAASALAATEAVDVGAGGTGGTGAGGDGGETTFADGTANEVSAPGGNGGAILAASATFGVTNPDDTGQVPLTGNAVTRRGAPGSWGLRNGPDAAGAGGNGGGSGGGAGRGNNTGQAGAGNSGGGGGGAGNNASQSARNGGDGGSGLCVVVSFFD